MPPFDCVSFIRRNRTSVPKEEPVEQDYEVLEEPPTEEQKKVIAKALAHRPLKPPSK